MPSPLQPGDHYVLRKLCEEVLPWMISGRTVGRQWFVRLAFIYGYVGDLAAALAGLGIGSPIVALLQGKLPDGQNAIDVLRAALPDGWFIIGVTAAIVWIILRLVIQREDVVKRALLARECARGMDALYLQLFRELASNEPMPQIRAIQKSVNDRVQDAVNNSVWPWRALAPDEDIEVELKSEVDRIRSKFMSRWAPPPPGAII